MTPRDIAERLARDAEGVSKMLLPNGKHDGNEWRAGSVNGEPGKSLGVRLTGDKAGVWRDFAADQGGDLLDLWAASKGVALREAINQAKNYLGIAETDLQNFSESKYRRPERPQCHTSRDGLPVFDYLTRERGILPETLQAYRIAEKDREIVLPSLRDDKLIAVKYLGIDRANGKKRIRVEPDCEPCLFGWQAIPESARTVAITEGEIDALSLYQFGQPALSVPFGGGTGNKQRWIETEFPHLDRFDEILLCLDADQPGRDATEEIAERLGRHRCRVIKLPPGIKDANDLLRAKTSPAEVHALFATAKTLDPAELRSAADFAKEVESVFYPSGGTERGFTLSWRRFSSFRFRPGELVLLAGVNGHGKSEIAGQIALEAMDQGERVCIASMEFKPARLIHRLTRQATVQATPSIAYIRQAHQWYAGKLWLFDVVGTAKADRILEVFSYARRRYGIGLFVIDNLAKCGFAEDAYNDQKLFVDRLTDFAKSHDCCVLLLLHTRKAQDETKPPGKMDIKGTGALVDMCDSALIAWRNKAKEEEIARADQIGAEPDPRKVDGPDAAVICVKQRNGEDEPKAFLAFCRQSHQYHENPKHKAQPFVEFVQPIDRDAEPAPAAFAGNHLPVNQEFQHG